MYDSRVTAEEASKKTTGREDPCNTLVKECSELREKERQSEGSKSFRQGGKEENLKSTVLTCKPSPAKL